jgi:hypothetical protein
MLHDQSSFDGDRSFPSEVARRATRGVHAHRAGRARPGRRTRCCRTSLGSAGVDELFEPARDALRFLVVGSHRVRGDTTRRLVVSALRHIALLRVDKHGCPSALTHVNEGNVLRVTARAEDGGLNDGRGCRAVQDGRGGIHAPSKGRLVDRLGLSRTVRRLGGS